MPGKGDIISNASPRQGFIHARHNNINGSDKCYAYWIVTRAPPLQGSYLVPNDKTEQDRNLQHHLFNLILDSLTLAPIKNFKSGVKYVLDIATGTGIWAIDFAKQKPSVTVLGMDLSPIQSDFVPVNCSFEVDDADDK